MSEYLAKDLPVDAVQVVAADITVNQVRQKVGAQNIFVIVDMKKQPLGIISPALLAKVSNPQQTLLALRADWEQIASLDQQISIRDAFKGMMYDLSIRWYIVYAGDVVLGACSRVELVRAFRRVQVAEESIDDTLGDGKKQKKSEDHVYENGWSLPGGALGDISNPGNIFGKPVAPPPSARYHCLSAKGHFVSTELVEERDVRNRALCPQHGSVMILELLAQKKG